MEERRQAEEEKRRAEEEEKCRAEEETLSRGGGKCRAEEERCQAEEEEKCTAEEERCRAEEERCRAEEEKKRKTEERCRAEEGTHQVEESYQTEVESIWCETSMQTDPVNVAHMEQQTFECGKTLDDLTEENLILKQKLASQTFGVSMIQGNDHLTNFYTGLSSWAVFLQLFHFLVPHVEPAMGLSYEDEFFLILVKLTRGLLLEDLASRFNICLSAASKSFQKWLEVMYQRLQFLIKWPPRDIFRENVPRAFKQLYPKCVCIIDCSEIFIDTLTNFEARTQTYSNYKKHNTVKFLIGITPCGSIFFLSHC